MIGSPDGVDDLLDLYNATLLGLLNKHAPEKEKVVPDRPSSPWINEAVIKAKQATLPTQDWLAGFTKRHPTLTTRLPEQLKAVRAKSSANATVLEKWFELVRETLEENNLINRPDRVFNVDETGLPLDPKRMKVICQKNIDHLFRVIGGSGRDSITVNGCASADGRMLPPM